LGSTLLGGILSYLTYYKKISSFFDSPLIKNILYSIISVFFLLVIFNVFYINKIINHLIFGIFTAILIWLFVKDNLKFGSKNFSLLNGKISFGIYVYHSLILNLVINYFNFNENSGKLQILLIILTSIILIFVVSYLSFFFLEKKFNDLRKNFQRI